MKLKGFDEPRSSAGRTDQRNERRSRPRAASGLVAAGEPLLVLLSGGADSVCLLDVAIELGAERVARCT